MKSFGFHTVVGGTKPISKTLVSLRYYRKVRGNHFRLIQSHFSSQQGLKVKKLRTR